jgi:hypothetical protein
MHPKDAPRFWMQPKDATRFQYLILKSIPPAPLFSPFPPYAVKTIPRTTPARRSGTICGIMSWRPTIRLFGNRPDGRRDLVTHKPPSRTSATFPERKALRIGMTLCLRTASYYGNHRHGRGVADDRG